MSGVWLANDGGRVVVLRVVPGSAAATAGIVVGGTLVAVDARGVEDLEIAEVVRLLSTSSGKLTLEFRQTGGRSINLVVLPAQPEGTGRARKAGGHKGDRSN